jgi:hypothetical protein
MTEQQLDGPQVASAAIDQRGLGPTQRMRTEQARIETDAAYPVADETRILPDRKAPIWSALRGKKEISSLPVRHTEVIVDRLPGKFGDLKLYRPAGLLLADRRAIDGVSVRAMSSTLRAMTSQPRSLLSMARLNSARSRLRFAIWSFVRIDQTCFGRNGDLAPVSLPLFQGIRLDATVVGFSPSSIVEIF